MFITIEVAVTDSISNTDRGILLEKLGYEVLESMQYEVNKQVRLTGIEVDLLATHKITSEEIYVECKAQRDNLAADVITKLLGNVAFKGVSAGWLISTSTFGKDGRGLALEWQKKPLEERRKLQLYTPENLAKLLISCGQNMRAGGIEKNKDVNLFRSSVSAHNELWPFLGCAIDGCQRGSTAFSHVV